MGQRGFAHVVVLVLLLAGIGFGVSLLNNTQIFKSKAGSGTLTRVWVEPSIAAPGSTVKVKAEGSQKCSTNPRVASAGLKNCIGPVGDCESDFCRGEWTCQASFLQYTFIVSFTGGDDPLCTANSSFTTKTGVVLSPSPAGIPIVTPKPTAAPSPVVTIPPGNIDLDVTFIERTPRYDYGADNRWPNPGETVTFTAHIRNMGENTGNQFAYKWFMDGTQVSTGNTAIPASRGETAITYQWVWQNGNHTVKFQADPNNSINEKSESNNVIEDRTNALAVGFWVEKTLRQWFDDNQNKLGIGSSSWEDWAQRQIREWNKIMDNSTYVAIPGGIKDRLRLDKVVVADDNTLPLNGGGPAGNYPDTRDKTVDLIWGFAIRDLLNKGFYDVNGSPKLNKDDSNPFYIEWTLSHELSHARYLMDDYNWDFNAQPSHDFVQVLKRDGTKLLPKGVIKRYECDGGMMNCQAPAGRERLYSQHAVYALNLIAGRRAKCGNYNTPCNVGEFLLNVPADNRVKVLDINNQPVAGVSIFVYQALPLPIRDYGEKVIDNIADITCTTDSTGTCSLGNQPFGYIKDGWAAAFDRGIDVIKVTRGDKEFFRWLYLSEANLAYWKGSAQTATYEIKTDFTSSSAPVPPSPTQAPVPPVGGADTTPPVVVITTPNSSVDRLWSNQSVTISATVTDTQSGIQKVEFYDNGTTLISSCTKTVGPFICTYQIGAVPFLGTKKFGVKAYDKAGNASSIVTISVPTWY